MQTKKRTISFGKFPISGKRRTNEITVDIEYRNCNTSRPSLSICGYSWRTNHSDCIHGGQCFDELKRYLSGNGLFMTIYGLWKRNHLNDLDACANDEQRNAVEAYLKNHDGEYDYDGVCEYLKRKGVYTVDVNGEPCTYGMQWYYRPISKEDKKLIAGILKEV